MTVSETEWAADPHTGLCVGESYGSAPHAVHCLSEAYW